MKTRTQVGNLTVVVGGDADHPKVEVYRGNVKLRRKGAAMQLVSKTEDWTALTTTICKIKQVMGAEAAARYAHVQVHMAKQGDIALLSGPEFSVFANAMLDLGIFERIMELEHGEA